MNRERWRTMPRPRALLIPTAAWLLLGVGLLPAGTLPATAQPATPTAESLTMEIQAHLDQAQSLLDRVVAVEGPRTVENTLEVLNDLSIALDAAGSKSSLMENVHPDEEVRKAAEKGSQDVQAFVTALSLNREVYDALTAVDLAGADPLTRRMVEESLKDYRRAGVDRDEATRNRIKELKAELVEIGQDFDRNIRDDIRHILVDPQELAGVPADFLESHPPDENGKIKVTTQYPDFLPALKYCENAEVRERLYHEFHNRAYPANKEVFARILEKRRELAGLLGFSNWAHYITDDKMVGSPDNVATFLAKLDDAARARGESDYGMLLARKRKDHPEAAEVADHEKFYYQELVRAEEYDFDSQVLRAYFDYPRVKEGIFDLTSRLFNVSYRPVHDAPVWHESVECYDLVENGTVLGRFYLDMHPREGKYGHAAQFTVNSGVKDRQIPVAALVCNFPGGDGDGPALMEHDDVETFLHEFGHLLHTLFGGNQRWIDFSGVATEWDFVEAPSQMLEEWAIDHSTLSAFARHHETGETIPVELVEKLKKARDFGNGIYVRQQTFYSAISLLAHSREPETVDMDALVPELQEKYSAFAYVPGTHMHASFGHLEGYSAMYYTYMWSLVIAKDLFSKFDRANMLDPAVATEYRKKVLEPGGSKDAADLVTDFLGRPYGFESFRSWLNGNGVTP